MSCCAYCRRERDLSHGQSAESDGVELSRRSPKSPQAQTRRQHHLQPARRVAQAAPENRDSAVLAASGRQPLSVQCRQSIESNGHPSSRTALWDGARANLNEGGQRAMEGAFVGYCE